MPCVGYYAKHPHLAFPSLSLLSREETEVWAGRDKSLQVMQPASRVPGWNLNPACLSDSAAQARSRFLDWVGDLVFQVFQFARCQKAESDGRRTGGHQSIDVGHNVWGTVVPRPLCSPGGLPLIKSHVQLPVANARALQCISWVLPCVLLK